ncbi:MAG TPA: acylphosphatase [Candidatus Limnocylindrales bacterium]|nr:acylphosphatase [Candidatus Limnocylindrales bacterium]
MTAPGETPATQPIQRLEATVRGRVQGVGYRYFVLRLAGRLGLTGWVANRPDGSVHCVVEGPPDVLDGIELALRDGPPGAVVDAVQAVRMPATGRFERFEVRSAGHTGD